MYTDYHMPRNKSVQKLLNSPISEEMIDYMTWKATTVIPCTIPSPPQSDDDMYYLDDIRHDIPPVLTSDPLATPPLNAPTDKNHTIISSQPPPLPGQVAVPPLREFISNLVRKSGLHTGTFLATLVYLDRLRRSLYTVAKGMPCTCHRIFLSTLIVTAKYVNDTSPKNKHWARYSSVFSVAEVNLMEKQLLVLLDFHLSLTMDEFLKNIPYFLTVEEKHQKIPPVAQYRSSYPDSSLPSKSRTKQSHRYSLPANTNAGNSVRNYLAGTTKDYSMKSANAAVAPKLSDSAYYSDDYLDEPFNKSAPNLQALDYVELSPSPSHLSHQQGNIHYENNQRPHYNSNNPYRIMQEMDEKMNASKTMSPNMDGSAAFPITNQSNSVQDLHPRR